MRVRGLILSTETAPCENQTAELPELPAALPCAEGAGVAEIALPADTQFQSIFDLEAAMLRLPQAEVPLEHDFCAGLYARTIHIPAGTLITGAVHRHESFWVVRAGDLAFTNERGETIIAGPGQMGRSPVGVKRAGLALTDVVFTTFHANPDNELDAGRLWTKFTVAPSREALEASNHPALESIQ